MPGCFVKLLIEKLLFAVRILEVMFGFIGFCYG